MTYDARWSSANDDVVLEMMRAVRDEFPGGRVDEHWFDENAGGSVNGRRVLGRVLREAVERGVVSVDGRQAQNLAHHGSAGHDVRARDLLSASSASDEPVELYDRSEICETLREAGLLGWAGTEYKTLFDAFGWS